LVDFMTCISGRNPQINMAEWRNGGMVPLRGAASAGKAAAIVLGNAIR
jgi:hypothetical protein